MNHLFIDTEIAILILLLVACISSIYFKHYKFPYTVGLVIVGLLLGLGRSYGFPLQNLELSPDLILFLFIPPLVFASASNINHRLFYRNLVPALALAGPGLVISTVIIGALLVPLTPLNLEQAVLFGALISATDPVAVVALFEELGVPKRLNILVDGESILNDAAAIVIFNGVLSVIESGDFNAGTIPELVIRVFIVLLGGIMVGLVTGTLMRIAIGFAKDDPLIQASVSLLVAYIAFIVAHDYFDVSGVIAVLTAGLMVGRYKSYHLRSEIHKYLDDFWKYVSFLANSLIFLLVGFNSAEFMFKLTLNQANLGWILILAIIATYLARGLMIFGLFPFINPLLKDGPINWQYQLVSFWGGLRGAVALALVLSLANDFPNRELLIEMTLGVTLFTILVGGTTVGNLLGFLKLNQPTLFNQITEKEALLDLQKEVREEFISLETESPWSSEIVEQISQTCQTEIDKSAASLENFKNSLREKPSQVNAQVLFLQAIAIERKSYQRYYDSGFLMPRTLDRLKLTINLREADITEGKIPPRHPFELLGDQKPDLLTSIVRRFSPNSTWLRQEKDAQIQSAYEFNLALAEVSKKMISLIEQGISDGTLKPELGQDCLLYFQFLREQALEKQQVLASQQPDLYQVLQERMARQSVFCISQQKLDEYTELGYISEEMVGNIKAELIRIHNQNQ